MEQPIQTQPLNQTGRPVQPIQTIQQPIMQPPVKHRFDLRYIFVLLIIVGIAGGFFFATRAPTKGPTPTPIDTPTPSPKSKPVVPIATLSAYIDLTARVASLSSYIQNMNISDTSMTPPTVELPLGFPNQ